MRVGFLVFIIKYGDNSKIGLFLSIQHKKLYIFPIILSVENLRGHSIVPYLLKNIFSYKYKWKLKPWEIWRDMRNH